MGADVGIEAVGLPAVWERPCGPCSPEPPLCSSAAPKGASFAVDSFAMHYTALFGGGIRVAPYATFGSDELAHNVTAALQDRSAALMGNHGAVLVGADLAKVLGQVAYLEYVCDVQLRVVSSGLPPRLLAADEIERVRSAMSGYGQQPAR